MYRERAAFGAIKRVVSGRPAADAMDGPIDHFGAARMILIVSGTLNRATSGIKNEIRKITPGIPRKIGGPAPIRETPLLAAS